MTEWHKGDQVEYHELLYSRTHPLFFGGVVTALPGEPKQKMDKVFLDVYEVQRPDGSYWYADGSNLSLPGQAKEPFCYSYYLYKPAKTVPQEENLDTTL